MEAVDKIKAGTADNNGAVDNPDKIVTLRLASDVKPKADDAAAPEDKPKSEDKAKAKKPKPKKTPASDAPAAPADQPTDAPASQD